MEKIIAINKKASHDYQLLEKFEVGIKLAGAEVKSIKNGNASLKESFAHIEGGELFIKNMHIGAYKPARIEGYDPIRNRKLLANKKEISYLAGKINQGGLAIVPTKIYLSKNLVKIEIALAKGKKKHDKREDLKKRAIAKDLKKGF